VEKEFGTGALKITPAHDAVDFEIGKKHQLPLDYQIIGWDGKMNELSGELKELSIGAARQKSVEILEKAGALEKIEDYKHQVSTCYKCKTTIEPLPRAQWFVKMTEPPKNGKKSLRDLAVEAVKSKKSNLSPNALKNFLSLDAEYSRLEYFTPNCLGYSYSNLVLYKM